MDERCAAPFIGYRVYTPANAQVNLYDRLFTVPNPAAQKDIDFADIINPDSLQIANAVVEPELESATQGSRYQFERCGYFVLASEGNGSKPAVFHRTVTLRDSWGKTKLKPATRNQS